MRQSNMCIRLSRLRVQRFSSRQTGLCAALGLLGGLSLPLGSFTGISTVDAADVTLTAADTAGPPALAVGDGLLGVFRSYNIEEISRFEDVAGQTPVQSWAAVVNLLNFVDPGDTEPADNEPLDLFVRTGSTGDPALGVEDIALTDLIEGDGFLVSSEHFTATFTGFLNIGIPGVYTFIVGHDDGVRLTLGGQVVLESNFITDFMETSATVEFADTGLYPIVLEFFDNTREADLVLSFIPPGSTRQIVPTTALFSGVQLLLLTATPPAIPFGGVSQVMAAVFDERGQLAPDNTLVTFTTTAGTFGGATTFTSATIGGVAEATLTAAGSLGTAIVKASAIISQLAIVGSTTVQFIPSQYEVVDSAIVEAVIKAIEEMQQKVEAEHDAKVELEGGSSVELVDIELVSEEELAEILKELEALIVAMMEALAKVKAQPLPLAFAQQALSADPRFFVLSPSIFGVQDGEVSDLTEALLSDCAILTATRTSTPSITTMRPGIVKLSDALQVAIDIKPDSFPYSIELNSKGVIPVAILTTGMFDAMTVDVATVRFGRIGTEAAPVHVALKDVDLDGDIDMILQFNTRDTDIRCGDASASLLGQTFDNQVIKGQDSIITARCK